MSKVVLYIAASLDGYIAGKDGDISWLAPYETEDYGYADFLKTVGAIIMGSKTYETALAFPDWRYQEKKTYVATGRKLEKKAGGNIQFYSGDLKQLVAEAKAASEGNIWLVGGGQLIASFLKENLLDELILFTLPVVLGQGVPLFGDNARPLTFRFIKSVAYPSGLVQLNYQVKPE